MCICDLLILWLLLRIHAIGINLKAIGVRIFVEVIDSIIGCIIISHGALNFIGAL